MAMSGKKNPNLGVIKKGCSRGEVELQLGSPVKSVIRPDGTRVDTYEYEIGNEPSAGRALGHAVLDVLTLGVWEVVGTPVEGFQGEEHLMTVTYDRDDCVLAINSTPAPQKTGTDETASDDEMLAATSQSVKLPIEEKFPTPTSMRYEDAYALVVGISKYKHSGRRGLTDLIYADDDARAVVEVLKGRGWSDSRIKLLIDEQATKSNIEIALESWLSKAGGNDLILLFWSGHGFPDPEVPEKVYFATYDTNPYVPPTGYRMDRVRTVLEERGVRNVIVMADTCHAGKLITRGGEKAISIMPDIEKMRRERSVPSGWIFMVSADSDRLAIENSSWTNGAFTHCLVEALSGKADGFESVGPMDGTVTMRELRAYLNATMPDETQRVLGVAKRPVITTSTGDPNIWNLYLDRR
jgi:hypothetical protein